ncbi:MAG: DNA integrity scanning protein DisA [candidate division TA06 bacterium ADurb.Bin417]|uniref:Diadenylate cyclase n=1 Tax=candidate division TA06 bacterium ADurb.Bin417 TaxID=1852828 RepID=A0A1V5M7A7_UNCT6|nr:MAG: DNA integrity scanning protein DisA [candidate division TA06 bacterium ADurb.Bin417]
MVIFLITFLSQVLGLPSLQWVLEKVLAFGTLALLIIFQPEIRNALVRIGGPVFFNNPARISAENVEEIIEAVFQLAREKKGALVVLEGEVGLAEYLASGKPVDSELSKELLLCLFHPASPLHDGAVIISQNRIAGAGCFLPLSDRTDFAPSVGSRHRAALGLSEETDSLVVIVSEESGLVASAHGGRLEERLDPVRLRRLIQETFKVKP